MAAKVIALGVLALFMAIVVLCVQALPTLFDIMIVPAAVVVSAIAGRMSTHYF